MRHEPAGDPPRLGAAFWRMWTSSSLSNLADGILKIALPLVALRFTQSPTLIAGLTVALTLPWLLFALPAGALADRVDRRRAMIVANVLRGLLVGVVVFALALDVGSIWVLYAVALGIGICETVYDTSAQSILPQLVSRDLLSRANGRLHAAELTAQQFVGPPLGGLLVALGAVVAFAAPGGLWVVAVVVLALVPGRFRVERTTVTTMRADIAEGVRYLWRHRLLRTLAVMVGMSNLCTNAVFAVFVLYAVGPGSPLGLSEPGFGVLLTTLALGSLVGALVAERVEQLLGRAQSLIVTIVLTTLTLAVPALTTQVVVIGAVYVLGGMGIAVWNVITVSLRQRVAPPELLGRVNSGYRLVAWGTMPVGALAGGVVADLFGLPTLFLAAGALVLCQLALMRNVTDEAMAAAEEGDVGEM